MEFLQSLMKEEATGGVTVAGDIGGGAFAPGPLITRNGKKKRKLNDAYRFDPTTIKSPKSNFNWRVIGEMMDQQGGDSLKGQSEESSFDPADVISKLKDAEKQVDNEDDTVPFGMEDEEGNVVKVYVRAEQADEFESALASMLAGEEDDEDDDDKANSAEIAEVLFKLKDNFDIVDVEWPQIEGDEEEEATQPPAGGGMGGGEMGGEMPPEGGDELGGEMGDLEGGDELGDIDGEDEMDMEAEGGAESTLQQVIDMMKSDAEARKAESEARAKEAEARTAEAQANSASAKVKQEEQVLDMEAHEKEQKAQKDETDKLARMAKWKHSQASNAEKELSKSDAAGMMGDEEEEEEDNGRLGGPSLSRRVRSLERIRDNNAESGRQSISVQHLADELMRRLRANG